MENSLSEIKNEMKVILREKILYPIIAVSAILMAVGINSINLSNDMVMHNINSTSLTCALGSAKYGALSVVLAFSLLNILVLSRDKTKRVEELIGCLHNRDKLMFARITSVIIYGVISIFCGIILTIIMQTVFYHINFDIKPYVYCYGLITIPALIFSIFISTGVYLISQSIDITILFMLVLFFTGFLSNNYMLNWAQCSVDIFSDFAGLRPVLKLIVYNRILWSTVSSAVLLSGFLCRRKFEMSLINSFKHNCRRKFLICLTFVIIIAAVFIYIKEPYCSKFMPSDSLNINKNITLTNINTETVFQTGNESLEAKVSYVFKNNKCNYISFLKNEGLDIKNISINGKSAVYEATEKPDVIKIKIPQDKDINIKINYEGKIKYYKGGAVAGYICRDSIYLLENSNWLLQPLSSTKKKVDIKGSYTVPSDLYVITPGSTDAVVTKGNNKIWNFDFQTENINLGVFAGKYKKSTINIEGKKIEFYYSPKHEQYIKTDILGNETNMEQYIKNMFLYYSHTFGGYYSEKYPLKIVETSTYKSGGHSSGNVITFAEYMVNRNMDNGSIGIEADTIIHDLNIIAHEMSHQWWGTAVSVKEYGSFSDEGFAEYSSYKYIQSEFKDSMYEMLTENILDSWQHNADTLKKSYYLKSAENMQKLNKTYKERYENEIKSIRRYDKMPLQLLEIENKQGEDKFLNNLSKIYKNNEYNNMTYNEFIKEAGISKEEFER